jgi:hypothetical protein
MCPSGRRLVVGSNVPFWYLIVLRSNVPFWCGFGGRQLCAFLVGGWRWGVMYLSGRGFGCRQLYALLVGDLW